MQITDRCRNDEMPQGNNAGVNIALPQSKNKVGNNHKQLIPTSLSSTVGVKGFEPSTPCSQSRCANRTALHPVR